MSEHTPMMKQYRRIKSRHSDAILFFRLGDFYEMFDRDAKEVSHLLNLTLTKRNGTPMCGIPYHAVQSYIPRLLKAGKKIAICEQTSLPEKGKGIVDREVVEIVTPGTVTDEDFLDHNKNNYLVAIGTIHGDTILSYLDLSTGECAVKLIPQKNHDEILREDLSRLSPTELLLQESLLENHHQLSRYLEDRSGLIINRYPDWMFDTENSYQRLLRFFETSNLKGFGFKENDPLLLSTGVLFEYVEENSKQIIQHIDKIQKIEEQNYVGLDEATQKNLEIVTNMNDNSSRYSLLEVVDHTKTSMGGRELRKRLLHPLRKLEDLNERLNNTEYFYKDQMLLSSVRIQLSAIRDIERLTSRISLEKAHAKDLLSVKNSLIQIREIESLLPEKLDLKTIENNSEQNSFTNKDIEEIITLLDESIEEDPSIYLNEGRLIKENYNRELDELRNIKRNSKNVLEEYLEQEKSQSGIPNLKIKYNKIIGHFLEVTKSHLEKVPDNFIRRQSLVGSERYTTDRLNHLEEQLTSANEKIIELERDLFLQVRNELKKYIRILLTISHAIAALDCVQSFAYAATVHGWTKPKLNNGNKLHIIDGRHPVVEMHEAPGSFIPNSIQLDAGEKSFALITGPNMSGKSTFLRQIALIVLLSQVGSFVPAGEASIGMVDRIFCRVGASDNLARGESTFLVEMNETSYILHTATPKSLVIMDEVGRGTSTHDGLSIAWAVSEYLLEKKCKTLFATHYHELSVLDHPSIIRLYLDVKEDRGEIVFLKRVKEGSAERSYGLHVARLAGLPEEVLRRAAHILQSLERVEHEIPASGKVGYKTAPPRQTPLFQSSDIIEQEIAQLDIDNTTPLQILNLVAKWKKELES